MTWQRLAACLSAGEGSSACIVGSWVGSLIRGRDALPRLCLDPVPRSLEFTIAAPLARARLYRNPPALPCDSEARVACAQCACVCVCTTRVPYV